MSEEINPWRALRFACEGLERICMGTADEADSSSIAEKALFAAIGHMGVSDIAIRELAARAGEDAPGSEPQPAKVIVVTEFPVGDRAPVERRYTASQWDDSDYSRLRLIRSGHPVGSYQAGAWLSVREDGAEVPDATARALGIARRALEAVTRISDGNVAIKLAADALEEIFTETEL